MLFAITIMGIDNTKFYIIVYNMLFAIWLKYNFHISAQSGFYFDYFYKKISEIFVRNIFVYMSQFFGEKFMIEQWTKKFFFLTIDYLNNFINITKLNYFWFFFYMLIVSLYLICMFFIILIFII